MFDSLYTFSNSKIVFQLNTRETSFRGDGSKFPRVILQDHLQQVIFPLYLYRLHKSSRCGAIKHLRLQIFTFHRRHFHLVYFGYLNDESGF